ncbi:MAG: nicotinamide mononucleotide transporter [Bacteroidales bacterium]|nr:nicotinamide mononucleotide transporter [Bacteroidales bacterium]
MDITSWIIDNYIEIFGAVTGIIYVFLEIRQNIWLWPVGIITSAVYIWVFFDGKLYADMSLQGYYLVISILGWYWWLKKRNGGGREEEKRREAHHLQQASGDRKTQFHEAGRGKQQTETESLKDSDNKILKVSRLKLRTGVLLFSIFILIYAPMWIILDRLTDSPVPQWDSFITSLSVIATWMLARKILEHWFLWIIVNITAVILFYTRALYPTVVLYFIYLIMSFAGLKAWKKSLPES